MILTKVVFITLFFFSSDFVRSQGIQFREDVLVTNFQNAVFPPRSTAINIPDPDNHLQNNSIPYDQIAGSPYWNDSLQSARLYSGISYLGVYPVRINFATNEIYFQKANEELVLTDKDVTRIVFKTAVDSAVFISHVPNMLLNSNPVEAFVQVLNAGKIQMLKYIKRKVVSAESASRTAITYHFADEIFYYIKSGNKVENVRRLNKENITLFLPTASSFDNWIKENEINFKKENDIVRFLNYYNVSTGN